MGKDLNDAIQVLLWWVDSVVGLPLYVLDLIIQTVLLPLNFVEALFITTNQS